MYIRLLISIAVFASDIYTAIVLLAFHKWSSEIDPSVPIHISRWIFAGCIILSTLLVFVEFMIAIRIVREKNISRTYTNTMARKIYSIRGYNYFCLFGKITSSRSKTEYLALFVYFTLQGWLKIIFADGPRQVINALTLYSVLKVDTSFVETVKQIATHSFAQALVISVMLFSLTIWVFSVIEFLIALICAIPIYIHIDKTASGLEEYCYVRINNRIAKLVKKYHERDLIELKEANKRMSKQPTLPVLFMNQQGSSTTLVDKTENTKSESEYKPSSLGANSTATDSFGMNNRKNPQFAFENERSYTPEPPRKPVVRFNNSVQRKPVGAANAEPLSGDDAIRSRLATARGVPDSSRSATAPVGQASQNAAGRSATVPPNSQQPPRNNTPLTRPSTAANNMNSIEEHEFASSTDRLARPSTAGSNMNSLEQQQFASSTDRLIDEPRLNHQASDSTLRSTASNHTLANLSATQPDDVTRYNTPAPPKPVKELVRKTSRGFQVEPSEYPYAGRGMYERESEIIDMYSRNQAKLYSPDGSAPNGYFQYNDSQSSVTSPSTPAFTPSFGNQAEQNLLPYPVNDNEQHWDYSTDQPPPKPAKILLSESYDNEFREDKYSPTNSEHDQYSKPPTPSQTPYPHEGNTRPYQDRNDSYAYSAQSSRANQDSYWDRTQPAQFTNESPYNVNSARMSPYPDDEFPPRQNGQPAPQDSAINARFDARQLPPAGAPLDSDGSARPANQPPYPYSSSQYAQSQPNLQYNRSQPSRAASQPSFNSQPNSHINPPPPTPTPQPQQQQQQQPHYTQFMPNSSQRSLTPKTPSYPELPRTAMLRSNTDNWAASGGAGQGGLGGNVMPNQGQPPRALRQQQSMPLLTPHAQERQGQPRPPPAPYGYGNRNNNGGNGGNGGGRSASENQQHLYEYYY